MKILMVSYFFEPEITPRAFRTAELAKALARRGNEVTVVLPNKKIFEDHGLGDKVCESVKFVIADGNVTAGRPSAGRTRLRSRLPQWLLRTVLYFYNHEYFAKYDAGIYRALCGLEEEFDLLISISYPVAIHRAVMKAFGRNDALRAKIKVAEFSDPPMRGEYNSSYFPLYDIFMKKAGRFFDYFSIPVENALPVYLPFKERERIRIIPQGFDHSGIVLRQYEKNSRPTFALAGRFYRNTRDPEPLLRYLAESGRDFELRLYLIDRDPYFDQMIEKYARMCRGDIVVLPPLPRRELIRELSAMDFLVNHNFNYSTATPSKLIDYALTGRPVYSFRSDGFEGATLDRFLGGYYSACEKLPDPSVYDIDTIAARFEDLNAEQ